MSIQSYAAFKKEAGKYKASNVDYYSKSSRNAFMMKLIKDISISRFFIVSFIKISFEC